MGIFNKVVNILVLVFAIAGVTFSYLLFNKREQLVAGWEEMSNSITQTAKALEQNSGLKLSAKLNADALGHRNPENADLSGLKRSLPELSKAAQQVTTQRNSLAEGLNKTAAMLEVRNIQTSELQNVGTYAEKQKVLLENAQKVADRNNTILRNYVASANKVISTSLQALKSNPNAVSNNFNRAIDDLKNRKSAYEKALSDIARAMGAQRKQFVIQGHLGSIWRNGQYLRSRNLKACREAYENMLKTFGGHIEIEETKTEAAIRETKEETGLDVGSLEERAVLRFQFKDGLRMLGYVFFTSSFSGTLIDECEETRPFWTDIASLDYSRMWEDDRLWLPMALEGKNFDGRFIFDDKIMIDSRVTEEEAEEPMFDDEDQ